MKTRYERMKSESIYWKNRANDFHAAVLVLHEAITTKPSTLIQKELGNWFSLEAALPPVFHFLCATSLELALKACWIQELFKAKLIALFKSTGKKVITEDEVKIEIKDNFFTHDLCKLAGFVKLKLTSKEKDFLKMLTHEIYWCGRFPIPKTESIAAEYSAFLKKVIFLLADTSSASKLRGKKFDPDMIVNWNNYKKIWLKIENFYIENSIK